MKVAERIFYICHGLKSMIKVSLTVTSCHGNDFWRVFARQCYVVGLIYFEVAITDKW